MIGRQFESDPAGASRRYENLATPYHDTSRHLRDRDPRPIGISAIATRARTRSTSSDVRADLRTG
jgi:hypothetical protein